MSTSRYQRRTPVQRTRERVQGAVPALEFGNPIATFRAAITGDGTNLRTYTRQAAGEMDLDTVFWDYWQNGDERIFQEFIQPSGPDQGRLGAVTLLVTGWYMIRVVIDWDDFFTATNYRDQVGTNFDESGTKVRYLEKDDFCGPLTIDQFRFVWTIGSADEFNVEIVVGHDDTVGHTIPGGTLGAWAIPPMLYIGYLGGHSTDENFWGDV